MIATGQIEIFEIVQNGMFVRKGIRVKFVSNQFKDKAPTLWLLCCCNCWDCFNCCMRVRAINIHWTSFHKHTPSVKYTCCGFRPIWLVLWRASHLQSEFVSSQVSAQLWPYLGALWLHVKQSQFQCVHIRHILLVVNVGKLIHLQTVGEILQSSRRVQIFTSNTIDRDQTTKRFLWFLLILRVTPANHLSYM